MDAPNGRGQTDTTEASGATGATEVPAARARRTSVADGVRPPPGCYCMVASAGWIALREKAFLGRLGRLGGAARFIVPMRSVEPASSPICPGAGA